MKKWLKPLVLLAITVSVLVGCSSGTGTQNKKETTAVDWPLYEISTKDETVGYLLGSIHIGRSEMYPFPDDLTTLVEDSSVIYSEVMVDVLTSSNAAVLAQQAMLEEPHVLTNLNDSEKQELERRLESYNITLEDLEGVNYYGLTAKMQPKYITAAHSSNGVEQKMAELAEEYEVPNKGLELIEEQLQLINEAYAQIVTKDNSWIKDITKLSVTKKSNEKLIDMYIAGELEKNHAEMFESGGYEILLNQRNHNWMAQLKEILPTEDQTFIVVGAGHLYGDSGIIKLLQEENYEVEKIST